MHTLLHILLLGTFFAVIYFLIQIGILLFALEFDALALRRPGIYVISLAGGFVFALLKEFGFLGPYRHPLAWLVFCIILLSVSAARFFLSRR
jgi:hypothetical protein